MREGLEIKVTVLSRLHGPLDLVSGIACVGNPDAASYW
jgi:hypothetical protein